MANLRETEKVIFGDGVLPETEPEIEPLAARLMESVKNDTDNKFTIEVSKEEFVNLLASLGELKICRKKLSESEGINRLLFNSLQEAHRAFIGAETEAQGLRAAKKVLGWKFREPVSKNAIFWDYIKLITEGTDKHEAVEKIQKRYRLASWDAAFKQIQRTIKSRKDKFGADGYRGLLPNTWSEKY